MIITLDSKVDIFEKHIRANEEGLCRRLKHRMLRWLSIDRVSIFIYRAA